VDKKKKINTSLFFSNVFGLRHLQEYIYGTLMCKLLTKTGQTLHALGFWKIVLFIPMGKSSYLITLRSP